MQRKGAMLMKNSHWTRPFNFKTAHQDLGITFMIKEIFNNPIEKNNVKGVEIQYFVFFILYRYSRSRPIIKPRQDRPKAIIIIIGPHYRSRI